jgi:hypothetical protein
MKKLNAIEIAGCCYEHSLIAEASPDDFYYGIRSVIESGDGNASVSFVKFEDIDEMQRMVNAMQEVINIAEKQLNEEVQ